MSKHIVLLLIAIFVVTVTSAHDVESDFLKKVMPAKPVRDRFRNDPYGEKKRVFDTVGIFPRAEACATKFNVEFKLSHLVNFKGLVKKVIGELEKKPSSAETIECIETFEDLYQMAVKAGG